MTPMLRQSKNRLLGAILLLVVSVVFQGCTKRLVVPPISNSAMQACLQGLAARPQIRSLKALAEVEVEQDGQKVMLRYAILFQAPRELRIDILPPSLGYTLQALVAKDGRAVFFDHQEHRAYQSKDTRTIIGRMFGRGLSEQELVSYLLAVPVSGALQAGTEWSCSEGALEPAFLIVRNVFNGSESMRFSYSNWRAEGENLPAQVLVNLPSKNTSLRFNFSLQKLDLPIAEEKFSLAVPSGYQIEELSLKEP